MRCLWIQIPMALWLWQGSTAHLGDDMIRSIHDRAYLMIIITSLHFVTLIAMSVVCLVTEHQLLWPK